MKTLLSKIGKGKLIAIIIVVVLICIITMILLAIITNDNENNYELTNIDVEDYYEENSIIVHKLSVKDSSEILTEKQAIQVFNELGFIQNKVLTEYSIEGDYQAAYEISDSSDQKHPKYINYYTTKSGDFWTIIIYNGQILANPLSYNLQSNKNVQVVISETKEVTAYYSEGNMFYKIIPKETMLKVICVEKINAETLEQLTFKEIDALW